MRLEVGMRIKTNYSGPYRIKSITRDCTCPLYNPDYTKENPPTEPHIHLVLTDPDGRGESYLSHFIEETLLSIQKTYCGLKDKPDYDRIIIVDQDQSIQTSIF